MIVTPFLSAALISLRVSASGMPSAIMAMVRICSKIKRAVSTPNELCRLLGSYATEKLSAQMHNLLCSSQQSNAWFRCFLARHGTALYFRQY